MRKDSQTTVTANWQVITVAAVVTVVCSLPLYLTGALAPQINRDLPLNASDLGIVLAAYWVAGALGSYVSVRWAGLLTDRTAMLVSLVIVMIGLGAAGLLASETWHLLVFMGFAGLANGTGHPPANSQLQLWLPSGLQGLGFGIKQAAIPVASVLSGLAVPLFGATIGWRAAMLIGTATCVPILVLVLRYVRNEPRAPLPSSPVAKSNPKMPPSVRRKALRLSVVTLLAAGSFAASATLVTTVADLRDWSVESAALALAGSSVLGAILRVFAGTIPGFSLRGTWGLLVLMIALGAIGMLIMSIPTPGAFYFGMFLVQGPGWAWPGVMHFIAARVSEGHVGAVTGVVQTMVSISSALIPLATGFLLELFGVTFAWMWLALLLIGASSWGFTIWRSSNFFPTPTFTN